MDPEYMQDPFLGASSGFPSGDSISTITGLPLTLSSPKVAQLYNIFHPSDPIAYRLEPLITPAMSSMKPQPLPYTKKTISASVSGIGAKVGQSVSGLWSSLSSGIASSLLNRSLGLTNDDVARMGEMPSSSRTSSVSLGAGTNISAGGVITSENIPPTSLQREDSNLKKKQLAESTAAADRDGSGANAGTLIDDEIETLYAGFQKTRKGNGTGNEEWSVVEERGKKLRREESKVRALNGNGRVDYSIQEYVSTPSLLVSFPKIAATKTIQPPPPNTDERKQKKLTPKQERTGLQPHEYYRLPSQLLGRRRRLPLHHVAALIQTPELQAEYECRC